MSAGAVAVRRSASVVLPLQNLFFDFLRGLPEKQVR